MKFLLSIFLIMFLIGCKDSTPSVSSASVPSLNFSSNNSNQISLYRNNISKLEFSCHPEMKEFIFIVDGNELDQSSILMDKDLDCTDKKGFIVLTNEIKQKNNILIKNSMGSISQIFILEPPKTDYPTVSSNYFSFDEDTVLVNNISALSGDGSSMIYKIKTSPSNGTIFLNDQTGAFNYTPNTNYNGVDEFSVVAENNTGESNEAVISLNINPINDKPFEDTKNIELNEDVAKSIVLTGQDIEGSSLTYQIVQSPAHGTIYGTIPNVIYMPELNYNGVDSFSYKISDGDLWSDEVVVNLNILPVNDAPKAYINTLTVNEDSSINFILQGTDVDSTELSYFISEGPTSGRITGTVPNLTYTPKPNFYGVDKIVYTVSDGFLDSQAKEITINVNPVNDVPEGRDQLYNIYSQESKSIQLDGVDIDGDSLTFSIESGPSNGTLSGSGNDFTYVSNLGFTGTDSFTYKIFDGQEYSSIYQVQFNIQPTPLSTRSCQVLSGEGEIIGQGEMTSSDSGATWSSCTTVSCIEGYSLINNSCKTLLMKGEYSEYFTTYRKSSNLSVECSGLDCTYVGGSKIVETEDASCSGLTLSDSLGLFSWTCSEVNGKATFFGKIKIGTINILHNVVDRSGSSPMFRKLRLSLSGATQSASTSLELSPWQDNVMWASSVLSQANTVYVIPDTLRTPIMISASNVSLVGNYLMDQTKIGTTSCYSGEKCFISSIGQKFNYFEINMIPSFESMSSVSPNYIGLYLKNNLYSSVVDSLVQSSKIGVKVDNSERTSFYRNSFSNNQTGIDITGDNNLVLKNSMVNSTKGVSSDGDNNNFMNLTVVNNIQGLFLKGNQNNLGNSLFLNNKYSVYTQQVDESLFFNLVSLNSDYEPITFDSAGSNNLCEFFLAHTMYSQSSGSVLNLFNLIGSGNQCNDSWDVETINSEISTENILGLYQTNYSNYSSLIFSTKKSYIPEILGSSYRNYFTLDNSSKNYKIYDFDLTDYQEADFFIKNHNSGINTSDTILISQGDSCPSELETRTSEGYYVLLTEIPFSGGNNNGLCEDGETCEYMGQYGAFESNSFEKDKELCFLSNSATKVYPSSN